MSFFNDTMLVPILVCIIFTNDLVIKMNKNAALTQD